MTNQVNNAPTSRPAINCDFRNTKGLGGDWIFTRPSVGSFTDSNGRVSFAPAGTPRFEHSSTPNAQNNYPCKGLLIENERTNVLRGTNLNRYLDGIGGGNAAEQPWVAPGNNARYFDSDTISPCNDISGAVTFVATSGSNSATCGSSAPREEGAARLEGASPSRSSPSERHCA